MEVKATFSSFTTCLGSDSGQWFVKGFVHMDPIVEPLELNFLLDTGSVYNIIRARSLPTEFDLKRAPHLGRDYVRSGNRNYGPFPLCMIDIQLEGAGIYPIPFLVDTSNIYPYNLFGMHILLSEARNVILQRAKGLHPYSNERILFRQ